MYDKTLYIANIGDSRAVLASKGRALAMSVDHKPHRLDERERIRALGGRIIHYGTLRVEGVLAITRSFGDRRWKKYISATPEVVTRKLQEDDDYLILASDGLWDCVSNQEAVSVVEDLKHDIKHAAKTLCDLAFQRGSMDNITTFIIDLSQYR
jgi:protein phosphatase 1L